MRYALAIVLSLASAAAGAAVPLKHGLFVDHRGRCGAGHGYRYYEFDGRHLSYGAPAISEELKRASAVEYVGEHRSDSGALVRDRFTIESPTEFVWSSAEGTFRMRYCPETSLPKAWRSHHDSN
jgi:hypothetical protein